MQINIQKRLVKNYTNTRYGYAPEAIVIHISDGYLQGAESWFNNPNSKASSHYMIGKEGQIVQFVDDLNTAWHAGGIANPSWPLLKPNINPNLYTLGIEHEGFSGESWPQNMIESSARLIAYLTAKYKIPLDRNHVIGHYQINSVSRPNCPGPAISIDLLIKEALKFYEDPKMIQELQQQITALKSEIESLKKINTKLTADTNSIKAQNQLLKGQIDVLSKSAGNADALIQLQQTLDSTKRNLADLKIKNENLTKLTIDLRAENDDLKKALEMKINDMSSADLFFNMVKKLFNR